MARCWRKLFVESLGNHVQRTNEPAIATSVTGFGDSNQEEVQNSQKKKEAGSLNVP